MVTADGLEKGEWVLALPIYGAMALGGYAAYRMSGGRWGYTAVGVGAGLGLIWLFSKVR